MENAGTTPNFLVIGAAKCGTTALCALLGRHPEVFVHPRKELNFFSFDEKYAEGFDAYREAFTDAGAAVAIGEGSPSYAKRAKRPDAAARIAKHLPHARLIYIVRHPLRRMESAWLHARRSDHRTEATFAETVRQVPEYVDTSDYDRQLAAYADHFPAEQLKVLFFEDFVADATTTLCETFRFLGVDETQEIPLDRAPSNPSLGRKADPPLLKRVKRSKAFKALDRMSPSLANAATKPFQRALNERPNWDKGTLEFVRGRLEDGVRGFLRGQGKDEDYWGWE